MSARRRGQPQVSEADPLKGEEHLLTDPVFLIGNGKSRENFDLERLRSYGTIIGCNALYRDFTPDILIAIDNKLHQEIKDAGYTGKCIIPANRTTLVPSATRWKSERFNTSGCYAMHLISKIMKPRLCFMLGMDNYPGNVYDKTKNYAVNTLQNFTGVGSYYVQALNAEGSTIYINVNVRDTWPEDAHKSGKYYSITYDEFEKVLEVMAE